MLKVAGVTEVAESIIEVEKILGEPKRLSVVRGKVNPNFYEDSTLTPEGKRNLQRAFDEGQARIQKEREKLQEEGRKIQRAEEKLENRKEQLVLKVKIFEERYEQPVYA